MTIGVVTVKKNLNLKLSDRHELPTAHHKCDRLSGSGAWGAGINRRFPYLVVSLPGLSDYFAYPRTTPKNSKNNNSRFNKSDYII
jgi:hypothetical protein